MRRKTFMFYRSSFLEQPQPSWRSGATSKVYQRFDPRLNTWNSVIHLTNSSPKYYTGSKCAKFGIDFRSTSNWHELASKHNNISEMRNILLERRQLTFNWTWTFLKYVRRPIIFIEVIRIAITPPRIVRFCSNLIQSLTTSHPIRCKFSI